MGICFSAGDVSSGLLIFSAMQQEDDLKALESIVQFARGLGVFFLVLHVYWYCYEWLSSCGLTYGYADRLLLDNSLSQPHQAGLEAGKFVQQVEGRFTGLNSKTVQQVDVIFIGSVKSLLLRGQ